MKIKAPIIVLIVLVIALGIWIYLANKMSPETTSNNLYNSSLTPVNQNSQNSQSNQTDQSTNQLFVDSPLYKNAYLISTPTYDANTKKALSGFTITKTVLADGSNQITLNAQNGEYTTQTYVVKPGEKLYFIEMNLSDDNGSTDKFIGDDQAILVDANGYIVMEK